MGKRKIGMGGGKKEPLRFPPITTATNPMDEIAERHAFVRETQAAGLGKPNALHCGRVRKEKK